VIDKNTLTVVEAGNLIAHDIGATRQTMEPLALQGLNGRCCYRARSSSGSSRGGLDRERSEAYIVACWQSIRKIKQPDMHNTHR
jgi:hypothetical protein